MLQAKARRTELVLMGVSEEQPARAVSMAGVRAGTRRMTHSVWHRGGVDKCAAGEGQEQEVRGGCRRPAGVLPIGPNTIPVQVTPSVIVRREASATTQATGFVVGAEANQQRNPDDGGDGDHRPKPAAEYCPSRHGGARIAIVRKRAMMPSPMSVTK